MVTNGGRQRTGIALLANPQEYVLEVRSATIALIVGAASTVLWQAIRQALIPSIALGVAATVVVLLINFRRRSQWLQSLGRVLSDPSSSGSAFALVTEIRSMAANRTKPARIEEFIKTCVSRRRFPNRELTSPILEELRKPECDLDWVESHCANVLDARPRTRANVVDALAGFLLVQSPEQLILYGYSSTACEGLIRAVERGWDLPEILIVKDEQYGSDSVNEHEDVIDALSSIVTIPPEEVIDMTELRGRISAQQKHRMALIGCDAVDPKGRVLVPGVTGSELSGTGLLLEHLTASAHNCVLVVVAETFKLTKTDFDPVERTSSPSRLNLPIRLLSTVGLAAPFRGKNVQLLELGTEVDYLVTDAGILPEPINNGVPPDWSGAWLDRRSVSSREATRRQRTPDAETEPRLHLDEIQAVIFDCNGVIVDDEPDHFAAFATIVERDTGAMLTWQMYEEHCQGKTDQDGIRALRERGLLKGKMLDNLKAKQKAYRKSVRDPSHSLVRGIAEFVNLLASRNISRHLITASDKGWVEDLLATSDLGAGIDGEIHCHVSHPDRQRQMREILRAAGLTPAKTLVIDDSEANLELANALHMRTICMRTTGAARSSEIAEMTVADFEELLHRVRST